MKPLHVPENLQHEYVKITERQLMELYGKPLDSNEDEMKVAEKLSTRAFSVDGHIYLPYDTKADGLGEPVEVDTSLMMPILSDPMAALRSLLAKSEGFREKVAKALADRKEKKRTY